MNNNQIDKNIIAELVLSLLSESSGNLREDIHPESILSTELNFTKEDCLRLIKTIEKTYNQELSSNAAPISLDAVLEEINALEIENVADLIDSVYNEVELG